MSIDIKQALEEAARPGESRPFRQTTNDALVTGRRRKRRRTLLAAGGASTGILAAAAATALVIGGPVDRGESEQPPAAPSSLDSPKSNEKTEPLDLRALSEEELADQNELIQGLGNTQLQGGITVKDLTMTSFTRMVDGPEGGRPVVLALSPDGKVVFYHSSSGGGAKVAPAEPDSAHPVTSLAEPIMSGPGEGQETLPSLDEWSPEITYAHGIYRVAENVERVEVRLGSPNGPEPWRVSKPHDGYLYWAAWADPGDYDPGTTLELEWRAYDVDGNLIDEALLPHQPREVSLGGSQTDEQGAAQTRQLIFDVTKEHLDPAGDHLRLTNPQRGPEASSWYRFEWLVAGDPGAGGVEVRVYEKGEFGAGKHGDLSAAAGCYAQFDLQCVRRDLDNGGFAWVGEDGEGHIGVAVVRPSGDGVAIAVGPSFQPQDGDEGSLSRPMGLTIDDVIAVATDPRLDPVGRFPDLSH